MPKQAEGGQYDGKKSELSAVSNGLREAYRSTHFNFLQPKPFTLKVVEPSQDLANLYRDHGVSSATILTAGNPYSEHTSQCVNELAQSELEQCLADRAFEIFPGITTDVSGRWLGEPSVLALGISRDEASRLGNEFRENAIVWIGADRIPELILLWRAPTVQANGGKFMSFKRPNPSPCGVPLKDLEDALAPTTLKVTRKGDTLIVQHEKLTTHIDVIVPANPESETHLTMWGRNSGQSAIAQSLRPLPELKKTKSRPKPKSELGLGRVKTWART